MRVISRKALRSFWLVHPDSRQPLSVWFSLLCKNDYKSFAILRDTFSSADHVGDFVVFNIGGNKYRLIASIHFNRRKVYIRHVLTHQENDSGGWKR